TAQNGVGTTIAIADDPRVAQQSEEIGVVAEIGGITPYAITDPTDEVLHYMPTASVPNSLTRSADSERHPIQRNQNHRTLSH
ncbi:MAG: hypothetical protein OEV27_13720, partial [Nitrospira sp.]|nr:hypothetical protein [Nitrospira sp.]